MREIETLDGRKAIVTESTVSFYPIDSRFKLGRLDLQHLTEAMDKEAKEWSRKQERKER